VAARGELAGRPISMPRRAVLVKQPDGGWRLLPTQLNFAGGAMIAAGQFGGGDTSVELQFADMPLSLADIFTDLGLGGRISGVVDFETTAGGVPVGEARVKVDQLTRSGLVLTSRPIDLSMVLRLTPNRLETRAVIEQQDERRGRLQALITGLPASGALFERLQAGSLFAQLRYSGPADALWRLTAIETFDLTGPLSVAADVTGTLADPRVRGSVASDDLRIQSALTGTDLRNVSARGTFNGSRLRLASLRGTASNGGTVVGSGIVDLVDLGRRGPKLDIRIAARNARLLNANGLSATVTGPMRIVSDGIGGTIAGRLLVDRASWRLGTAAEDVRLPQIATREINLPADIARPTYRTQPWRYLINARAPSRVDVDGMGLDSEWGADILLRGTTDDPRIGGEARMIRGSYTFAGTRFELTRGEIEFDENTPIDPRLDIVAETDRQGFEVQAKVQGSAQQPEISFTSTPPLPEEEILARLLFGGSITELSATDVLQLGAAVASLRGGGGLDPINRLRTAIGLDRLRIVSADPALGRGTGIALGKNIGRRFYVEIVTDGRGYSATEVEFRVTSWLSLLATISTIGRESIVAEVSHDY
jgi:translocation and assembly module TamB